LLTASFVKGFNLYLELQQAIRDRFRMVAQEMFNLQLGEPNLGFPPSAEMGDFSITSCFDLARQLRQPPRRIAEQIASSMLPIEGVERVSIAGAGYVNFYLDRSILALDVSRLRSAAAMTPSRDAAQDVGTPPRASSGKILVEHTSINPNKAAHIGHLRNAALGDTLARLLRFRGHTVEVQNYIDNTGVQVADVVVGFAYLEKKSLKEVRELIEGESVPRFDYYCWDLYARVSQFYTEKPETLSLRSETLKAIEEGHGDLAQMADLVSRTITRLHLETMQRINIQYDLLVQESEILRLNFWKSAFELMKSHGAIYLQETGKNGGCWVMNLGEESPGSEAEDEVKIIVRSNGTVTYVGKDIAYHLWKFGLLERDFYYHRFYRYADGVDVWRTSTKGEPGAPAFGHARVAYAVIDSRQSYLQEVVRRALMGLGYNEQADGLHHFSYEVVGLSPLCAEALGLPVSEDDRRRSYVEVSGRKGLGIKADDLVDSLTEKALEELRSRGTQPGFEAQHASALMIGVSALRYFLLKYTRHTIIAFDFNEALAFEGETGPYLQYTVVRARNIFRKFREVHPHAAGEPVSNSLSQDLLRTFLTGKEQIEFWELITASAQLEMAADQAIAAEEPATLAKYTFRLAQAFNNFYHHHHILHEADPGLQKFFLFLVDIVMSTLAQALDLMGIEIPDQM
jgi:arginyl-tRNA synthetase